MTIASSPGIALKPAGPAVAPVKDAAAERAKLERAAKAFEAIFMRNIMASMRENSLGDDLTGSSAVDQFQEMSDANMANGMAERGGFGIAELLLAQLDRGKGTKPDITGAVAETPR